MSLVSDTSLVSLDAWQTRRESLLNQAKSQTPWITRVFAVAIVRHRWWTVPLREKRAARYFIRLYTISIWTLDILCAVNPFHPQPKRGGKNPNWRSSESIPSPNDHENKHCRLSRRSLYRPLCIQWIRKASLDFSPLTFSFFFAKLNQVTNMTM